ncbi:hypothetical protein FRC12_018498 [Ceratobasidium sp. 428]|nr:hypothetical protein FRC12_018498 [Ceratobasidium sp. 428]
MLLRSYFNPPRGIIVSQTAHCLPPALFSNHSAESPNGVLTGDVLKSFFAVSGTSGNLTYDSGYERIPENWYRREIGNDYGIVPLGTDIISMLHNVPEALLVGGNTGKVNSFTGVDFRHITNGVYNATNLLNGHNLVCFAYQALHIDLTSILKVGSGSVGVLGRVAKLFGCPELSQYDSGVFGTYPGAGDTYPSH